MYINKKIKIISFVLLYTSCLSYSEEMTIEKYQKIFNGNVTKEIREELNHLPIFDNGKMNIMFTSPNGKPINTTVPCNSKYIDGKYILLVSTLPNGVTISSILGWDDKSKCLVQWNLIPKPRKIWSFRAKRIEGQRYNWSGKATDGTTYKGKAEYTKNKILFQGDYFKDGVLTLSENGSIVSN